MNTSSCMTRREAAERLYSALRFALRKTPLSETEKAAFTPEAVAETYALSERLDLSHLLGFALKQNGLISKEDPMGIALEKKWMLAVFSTERIVHDTQKATALLEKLGVAHVPLKGARVRAFYPEGWMRTSCDVDILVNKEDCERAMQALEGELGYRRLADHTLHDYQLSSPGNITLELHYTLIEEDLLPAARELLAKAWENTEAVTGKRFEKAFLAEYFLLYHLLHMAKHFVEGGCGIRPFLDLVLLEEALSYRKDRFAELLKESGMERFYHACLSFARVIFGEGEHDDLTLSMERYLLSGGTHGSLSNQAAMQVGKGEKKNSFWRLVFLPRQNLEVIYPRLKEKPSLFLFYQVKRWFRIFNPQKRKKIRTIGSTLATVSDESALAAANLLSQLNLKG